MGAQSFCTKCGAALDAGQKFCTACGSTIGKIVETSEATAAQSAPAPCPQPRGRGGVAIAILSVVAIAAIILVVLLSTGAISTEGNTPAASSTQTETADDHDSEDTSPAPDSSDETDNPADGEVGQETLPDTGEDVELEARSASATETASLDLNNEDDYYRINLCLSNFSEINSIMNGYRNSRTSSDQVFYFAYAHALLNSSKAVQFGEYWPSSGEGPYYARASFESLEKYANLFLKEPLTADSIPYDTCYEDGYVYTNLESIYPEGIALATDMEYLGNEQYQIEFEIYCDAQYEGESYTVTDESYYHMTPQELASEFNQRFPSYVGTAVLEAGYEDEVAPFKLLSYDSSPV